MARFKSTTTQKINFSDIANFSEGIRDLDLLDILNDASKEKVSDTFISAPGAYVYELDLTVDEKKVIELGVLGFKVEIFNKNPNKQMKKDRGLSRGQSAKSNRVKVREFLQTSIAKPVLDFNIDLNIPLPLPNFQFLSTKMFKPPKKIYPVFFSAAPLTNNKYNTAQITSKPLKSNIKNSGIGLSFTNFAKQSILKNSSDPSAMMAKPTPAYPTLEAKVSKASVPYNFSFHNQSIRVGLDDILVERSLNEEREKAANLNVDDSTAAIKMSNLAVGKENDTETEVVLGYKAEIECSLFKVKREIEIPKSSLGMRNQFYVRITPILKKSESLLKKSRQSSSTFFSVNHKSKVNDLLMPVYPPEISLVMDKKGVVILNINQVDPAATSVTVFKRVYSPRTEGGSIPMVIEEIRMESDSPRRIVSDLNAENIFPNKLTYRAVAKSPGGQSGPCSSLVITGHANVNMPFAKADPNDLSIIAVNEEDRIKIEVERIPSDVIGIRLLKEEIDESGSLSSRVRVISSTARKTLTDTHEEMNKVVYYDFDADLNRRYRYFCALRPKLGNEFLSEEDEHIIRKKPMKPLPVEVTLSNLQMSKEDDGNFSVSIDAISIPRQEGLDFLLDLLQKSGVSQIFIDSVKTQRSEMANLAAFMVERVDRNTGRRVSFGFHGPGTFSDNADVRSKMNLPNLVPAHRYTYFFKLCLRPPQSFIKGVMTQFSSGKKPGVDDEKALAQKFLSAYAGSFGAMPSDKELNLGISTAENFRLGETGLTLQLDVITPKPKVFPTNLRLKKYKKHAILTWAASQGDVKDIDHCLVFVETNGIVTLLGTAPSSGLNATFTFKDTKYAPQVGGKKYFVKFVYSNFKLSPESNKVYDTIVASLSPAFFAKSKTIKVLGLIPGLTKKMKLAIKNQTVPSQPKISDIAKKMNAPGWGANINFKKKF